ncbi:MAG: hypothetical protein JXB17_04120 [Bacteroidales bacterium]|nr:hypothetical protein [Bacteroidales bacterium]
MKKKYFIVFLIFSFLLEINILSQHHGGKYGKEKREMICAERIAFFTEQIGLTPEEAEKFWPVFNEFYEKKDEIHDRRRAAVRELSDNQNLSEKEMEDNMNVIIKSFEEETKLMEEYQLKYKEILPIEKISKIYVAEHQFKKYLLHKIKGNKGGKNN